MLYVLFIVFTLLLMNHNSTSTHFILANSFTLLAGFYFLYINFTQHLQLAKERKWKTFFIRNILVFIVCYLTSVILYTIYLISLGESSFQLKHIFMTSYPYKSNVELILLYFLGFVFGAIRRKYIFKIVKATIITALICITCIFGYMSFSSPKKIHGVEILEGKFNSIENIISLPQFQNKTVYVDLWFSNCGDCIDQMKNHLPAFKEHMIDSNFNMEYVYLGKETSGPLSKKRWWNSVKEYKLKGWHYYFEKTDEKQFWTTIIPVLKEKGKRSYGYPQYVIAQNGRIIDYDAPNPEFHKEIVSIIKSQNQLK